MNTAVINGYRVPATLTSDAAFSLFPNGLTGLIHMETLEPVPSNQHGTTFLEPDGSYFLPERRGQYPGGLAPAMAANDEEEVPLPQQHCLFTATKRRKKSRSPRRDKERRRRKWSEERDEDGGIIEQSIEQTDNVLLSSAHPLVRKGKSPWQAVMEELSAAPGEGSPPAPVVGQQQTYRYRYDDDEGMKGRTAESCGRRVTFAPMVSVDEEPSSSSRNVPVPQPFYLGTNTGGPVELGMLEEEEGRSSLWRQGESRHAERRRRETIERSTVKNSSGERLLHSSHRRADRFTAGPHHHTQHPALHHTGTLHPAQSTRPTEKNSQRTGDLPPPWTGASGGERGTKEDAPYRGGDPSHTAGNRPHHRMSPPQPVLGSSSSSAGRLNTRCWSPPSQAITPVSPVVYERVPRTSPSPSLSLSLSHHDNRVGMMRDSRSKAVNAAGTPTRRKGPGWYRHQVDAAEEKYFPTTSNRSSPTTKRKEGSTGGGLRSPPRHTGTSSRDASVKRGPNRSPARRSTGRPRSRSAGSTTTTATSTGMNTCATEEERPPWNGSTEVDRREEVPLVIDPSNRAFLR